MKSILIMKKQNSRRHLQPEGSWGDIFFLGCCGWLQQMWRRVVVRKWLNIADDESDYSADTESDSDSAREIYDLSRKSLFKYQKQRRDRVDDTNAILRLRRRKSETFKAQYIKTKEIKICAATWNVGGKFPPDDLDLDGWLDVDDPADIYVISLQEIIPLDAGNVLGAEDARPVPKWENIIRETLNRIRAVTKFKSLSNPSSPSRFRPSEDAPNIEDDFVLESDIDIDEETCSLNELSNNFCADELHNSVNTGLRHRFSSSNRQGRSNIHGVEDSKENEEASTAQFNESRMRSNLVMPDAIDLDCLLNRKRRRQYIRIVSKQMVGIFVTIWARRRLRRHIKNLNVCTVGVGLMGYIGNKGSISVSMSVYQTRLCFVCSHLTSGERESDAVKRNADVIEIHRQTRFRSHSRMGFPRSIYDHERIFWIGDLNYRIDLPYEQARELISKGEWPTLLEYDQLSKELQKGRPFDGWSEGTLSFAPTYKYEFNSEDYFGEDPRAGRRTPAWCDRILCFGTGIKLLNYRRSELKLSDHRPVTASYFVEVEVFAPHKLRRALSFTDAEIMKMRLDSEMGIFS